MNTEQKNDDLQSLAKEHLRMMRWLIRVLAFQSIFIITMIVAILWLIIIPLFVQQPAYMY